MLSVLLIIGVWYVVLYARRFRNEVTVESVEALAILRREFTDLQITLSQQERILAESRSTKKVTKAEAAMVEAIGIAVKSSQQKVEKEIEDITALTRKNK